MDLNDICNKIDEAERLLKKHGYEYTGAGGSVAWSNLYLHANGTSLDIYGSGWTMYDAGKNKITSGLTSADLDLCLTMRGVVIEF